MGTIGSVAAALAARGSSLGRAPRRWAAERNSAKRFCNIDDVWVVTVTALNAKGVLRARRYILGSGNSDCMTLPLLGWPGSTVTISGVLQDTLAIPSFASKTPAQISEDCFNVEGFTVGLTPVASGFNPQDPTNVIDALGYGLAWAHSDHLATAGAGDIHRG